MRILVCTLGAEPSPVGGAERQAWRQAVELATRGHSVTIVCPWTPGTRSGGRSGVRIVRLPQAPVRYIRTLTYAPFLFLYIVTRGREADLVHVHLGNLQADAIAPAARLVRRPVYLKIAAGGPLGEVQRFAWLAPVTRRIGIRWPRRVQAISDEIEADLMAAGVRRERIVRIPNGLDTDLIAPASLARRRALRSGLGLPRDRGIVLYLGRFAGYKGIADLLAAWAVLDRPALLLLVGEPALDDPIPLPEASESVMVRGWTSDVGDYLGAADILVQPSHAEGMSNTMLEAMAAGLAIVATDVGAAREMLRDGAGIVVPPRDPERLAAALSSVLDNPDRRAALGAAARAAAVDRYSIRSVVDRIEAAYAALLAEAVT
jgi:glycosyltransferase involved in cell wall biosynthesis